MYELIQLCLACGHETTRDSQLAQQPKQGESISRQAGGPLMREINSLQPLNHTQRFTQLVWFEYLDYTEQKWIFFPGISSCVVSVFQLLF